MNFIRTAVIEWFLGEERQAKAREKFEAARVSKGLPHEVHYFHDPTDPYSALTAQVLSELVTRYDIELTPHLVPAPDQGAAPEAAMLDRFARTDAERLAQRYGLSFRDGDHNPLGPTAERAARILAAQLASGEFIEGAGATTTAAWGEDAATLTSLEGSVRAATTPDPAAAFAQGGQLREKLGHYLGATFYYGGEWYWGLDRLHYLESRLSDLGAARSTVAAPIAPPWDENPSPPANGERVKLDFYLSLRSPYTYLAAERIFDLAEHHGAEVRLRYVLPMVMRNLPVPRSKRFYIGRDTKREAVRLGYGFGKIADPVGRPTERGLSVLRAAVIEGKGREFLQSFMRGVWAEGINAGSRKGLQLISERAGISWPTAQRALSDDSWRAEADENRRDLGLQGLWGVPSFRVGHRSVWGQDRLWYVDEMLREPLSEERVA